MTAPLLTPQEVRAYISDYESENHLLDKEEFSDVLIQLNMSLALDLINSTTPISSFNLNNFTSKVTLLFGTLYMLFNGKCAHLARNHMQYSDGGLQIPIEERMQLYQSLASTYKQDFQENLRAIKNQLNMESGWGSISSSYAIHSIPIGYKMDTNFLGNVTGIVP